MMMMYTPATYDKEIKKRMKVRPRKPNLYISMQKGGSLYLKDCLAAKLEGQDF